MRFNRWIDEICICAGQGHHLLLIGVNRGHPGFPGMHSLGKNNTPPQRSATVLFEHLNWIVALKRSADTIQAMPATDRCQPANRSSFAVMLTTYCFVLQCSTWQPYYIVSQILNHKTDMDGDAVVLRLSSSRDTNCLIG